MDPLSTRLALGAAGAAGGAAAGLGVEEVFSTWLYTGTGSTQTITNGIDLSGEGGMTWIKLRSVAKDHGIFDTERGAGNRLESNTANSSDSDTTSLTAFNSDGFTLGTDVNNEAVNLSGATYASWTFRKAPGFFDVVTYTGDGTAGRTVSHNLGSVPGCILVKRLDTTENWRVYHRSLGATKALILNDTGEASTSSLYWNDTAPTSTNFSVGAYDGVNGSGYPYVAYVFAHDEAIFGESADQSIIKCGGWTGTGSSLDINLGWEPQFVIVKSAVGDADHFYMFDNMRSFLAPGSSTDSAHLRANSSYFEGTNNVKLTSTGFQLGSTDTNKYGKEYIYIAIRRGPMKTPEDATKVFGIEKLTSSQSSPAFRTGVVTDMGWARRLSNGSYYGDGVGVFDRLRGDKGLATGSTAVEYGDSFAGDNMIGFYSSAISGDIGYSFRRANGFFDVVAYTGTGSATTVSHNLGVAPELMIVKRRNSTGGWFTYNATSGETKALFLNGNNAELTASTAWNNTAPTSSVFTVGTSTAVNASGGTYVAYLFATVSGVSKIGSYSGTGSTLNVDCGFSAGARFVLIKRTDSSGDWYVWDTARGIVSGNDPYILLNSTAAETTSTDYIDPLNAGFTVTSSAPAALNASGGSYIFLAIA